MNKKMNTTRDTNILKLHELHEKCVNFYKIPKYELIRKNTPHDTRKTRTRHGYTNCQIYSNPCEYLKALK